MRHNTLDPQTFYFHDLCNKVPGIFRRQPDPAHAGVDLYMDRNVLSQLPGGIREGHGSCRAVHERGQVPTHDRFRLFGIHRTHNQHGRTDAGCSEFPALFDQGNAEHVRSQAEEVLGNRHRTVSVCLCLDDSEDLSAARPPKDLSEVMRERVEINKRSRRPV